MPSFHYFLAPQGQFYKVTNPFIGASPLYLRTMGQGFPAGHLSPPHNCLCPGSGSSKVCWEAAALVQGNFQGQRPTLLLTGSVTLSSGHPFSQGFPTVML